MQLEILIRIGVIFFLVFNCFMLALKDNLQKSHVNKQIVVVIGVQVLLVSSLFCFLELTSNTHLHALLQLHLAKW